MNLEKQQKYIIFGFFPLLYSLLLFVYLFFLSFVWLLFSLCAAGGAVFGFLRLKSIIDGPVITPPKKTITSSNSSQSAPAATSVKTNTTNTSTELYCRKCGRKLNVLQAFCQSCGTPVSKNND